MAKFPWGWVVGGGAALGTILLVANKKASAAGAPAPAALTRVQQIQKMTDDIHQILSSHGYVTPASYVTPTSATEQIVDGTPAGRNLVAKNQGITDKFLAFMWAVNGYLKYHTADPNTDETGFQTLVSTYNFLKANLTDAFLAG